MFRRLALAALLYTLSPMATAATVSPVNLLLNGSFEELPAGAALSGRQWSVYTSLPGWQVDRVEIQQGSVIAPFEGLRYAELDTHGFNSNATISQSFATLAGNAYRLRFAYAPRPELSAESNSIRVSWGDPADPASLLINGATASNIAATSARWRLFEFSFVASGETSLVRFAAAGRADTRGGLIDGVSVSSYTLQPDGTPEVPVPAAVWLFGSALVGAAGIARRREAPFR